MGVPFVRFDSFPFPAGIYCIDKIDESKVARKRGHSGAELSIG